MTHLWEDIKVTTEDEEAVIAFLQKHWATMQKLWAPFTEEETTK